MPQFSGQNVLHMMQWVFALISFSCAATAANYEKCYEGGNNSADLCVKFYDEDYTRYCIAAGIFVWLASSAYIIQAIRGQEVKPLLAICVDLLLALFAMAAAGATTRESDCSGASDQFPDLDSSFCDTYRAGIAFMWFVFFCYIPLLIMDFKAYPNLLDDNFSFNSMSSDPEPAKPAGADPQTLGTAV